VSNRLRGPMACLLFAITAATMMFILAPLLVTVAISISDTSYVVFPPRGFTFGWYAKVLQDTDFHASLCFSCLLAVGATVGALLQLFVIIRSNSAPLKHAGRACARDDTLRGSQRRPCHRKRPLGGATCSPMGSPDSTIFP
jgi:ABC-type sugar transport system permease subunit